MVLMKELSSYGSKILENMFIALTLSRQMCYYYANERPNINTDKTATLFS